MNKSATKTKQRTYISLFSSAGVGCYAFKEQGFHCVATNEIIEKRLEIQRINKKCKYKSGYISGDITTDPVKNKIFTEIKKWKDKYSMDKIDVLIATPPCQGMSTANYKKNDETIRNSLVVEAIYLTRSIKPRIFIYENVPAFMKTICVDYDNKSMEIEKCIDRHLSDDYNIYHKVINFMDYGIPSSRPRTIVIGTLKSEKNFSPLNLFPLKKERVSLRQSIGDLPSLDYGQISKNDLYHAFRTYPKYMREWIHDLKEGESAFSKEKTLLPYKLVDGKRVTLKSGHMGNKFRRMIWDSPAPCITTRNDQLASQTTIHPCDDRVLSIRELMRVMAIPSTFKWVKNENENEIKANEGLIRKSIGEAVPTMFMAEIAKEINTVLDYDDYITYGINNGKNNFYINSYIIEKKLSNAKQTGSFYTPQIVVYNAIKNYFPKKKVIKILEPSVGMGAFIPQFLRVIDDCISIEFDLCDISRQSLQNLKRELKKLKLNKKITFNFINDDFILHHFERKYDAIITNPPYFIMKGEQKIKYRTVNINKYENIFCLFLEKCNELSNDIMCVIPKNFLVIPDCNKLREYYQDNFSMYSIHDYGVNYFEKVFIEILSIHFTKDNISKTHIENRELCIIKNVKTNYIYHDKIWLLYRDRWFDEYIKTLKLDVFDYFRDRQLTTTNTTKNKKKIWVIKSKNLNDEGKFVHIKDYDTYINELDSFNVKKFFNRSPIVFVNFTYNTRASILPKNAIVNGSFCILIPKTKLTKIDLSLYSSPDFRKYYSIIKNLSKFTLNVDLNTIYYIGVKL